jgi:hypothetical protein
MIKKYREATLDNIDSALWDALMMCSQWCEGEDYTYDLADLIAMAKLILEQEERYRVADEN